MRKWQNALETHVKEWINFQMQEERRRPSRLTPQEISALQRARELYSLRKAKLLKLKTQVHPYRVQTIGKQEKISYQFAFTKVIKIKDHYHLEEQIQNRECTTHDGRLVIDQIIEELQQREPTVQVETSQRRSPYDRRKAVQYAERWWNDYNPSYRRFTNNCTNFVSQCLQAGGAPMTGMPNREKGWWYQGDSWSYSWAVAHSFRWFLSSANHAFSAAEVERATDLREGDVICYDFNGNGRWQHSTIVTSFDGNKEPLVNAQTSNSRSRYWKYEDSTAWTPNIRYKFFRID
ncbi:amidase domain-containing protein [Alteribacillus iranensis]|uniref:Putative amidase domain-containing protein n=1 Tax=Alteribacillus iranensis TaxID=930128 RepID=A0A1I2FLX4_9BACI|nr:amidase domain-containing protein [Alteribacillus iranensis]SFF06023.1 Putative amidase domain-containing protein [Alteribacillus iranensis]